MKKTACILLMVMLSITVVCAHADDYNGEIPEYMFVDAINSLVYMSKGDYQSALDTLQLSGSGTTADDLVFFAQSGFSSLSENMKFNQAIACYASGYDWVIAVPLWEPNAMDVETFILHSKDGLTFDRYNATTWAFIDKLMTKSETVIFYNTETAGSKFVIAD